jgi:predicted nucleic acid-binding protein
VSGFIDTNVLIRLLTRDDRDKLERCRELFRRANRGEIELTTSEAVIAETVFVLSSPRLYAMKRAEIALLLGSLLGGSSLFVDHKSAVLDALELYGLSNLHFVDCLGAAHARRAGTPHTIYSYDRELDLIPDIQRREP